MGREGSEMGGRGRGGRGGRGRGGGGGVVLRCWGFPG